MRVAPVFAAFAGMDLLGKGIKKTLPAGRCVGGSEKNNTTRLLFKRQHGFEPFKDQQLVPDYAYDDIFLVTTGVPCVAFPLAGKQRGQADARDLHYVEQADGYIRAKVLVILFEQVPEARRILSKDWKARKEGKSPQDQLVEKLRDNGYTVSDGPDGQAGMILNAAGLGGVLDKKRLFTIAIIDELWEHSNGKETFKWPEEQETQRSIKGMFREPIREDHLATEHMKQHFEPRERYTKTGTL